MGGLTEEVVRFALGARLTDAPLGARSAARSALLDTLACALGGLETRVARAVRDLVTEEGAGSRALLWGTRQRASTSRAALVNGTAAHALDYDDVSWAMSGHPSAPLLPAVLATAEATAASGTETLAAYMVGFEVCARLGQAMGRSHYERGWHPTSTVGAIGATVAAGRLIGLEKEGLRRALGLVCSTLAGSRMNFGTDTKPLHAGFAAQAGVLAAELAVRGVTARSDPLDAEMGPFELYDGAPPAALPLGHPWALVDPGVEIKPYPSCRFTHRIIDAVRELRQRHPGATVRRFTCSVDPFALKILIHPRPTDGLQAKFSLPYCAAVTWLDGWPSVGSFDDARARREDVQALLERVEVQEAAGPTEEVVIRFESGEEDRERVRHARGNPARPMDRSEHLRKVHDLCDPLLGSTGTRALVEAVDGIEELPEVSALVARLAAGGAA